jgi:hypothetical protein
VWLCATAAVPGLLLSAGLVGAGKAFYEAVVQSGHEGVIAPGTSAPTTLSGQAKVAGLGMVPGPATLPPDDAGTMIGSSPPQAGMPLASGATPPPPMPEQMPPGGQPPQGGGMPGQMPEQAQPGIPPGIQPPMPPMTEPPPQPLPINPRSSQPSPKTSHQALQEASMLQLEGKNQPSRDVRRSLDLRMLMPRGPPVPFMLSTGNPCKNKEIGGQQRCVPRRFRTGTSALSEGLDSPGTRSLKGARAADRARRRFSRTGWRSDAALARTECSLAVIPAHARPTPPVPPPASRAAGSGRMGVEVPNTEPSSASLRRAGRAAGLVSPPGRRALPLGRRATREKLGKKLKHALRGCLVSRRQVDPGSRARAPRVFGAKTPLAWQVGGKYVGRQRAAGNKLGAFGAAG